MIVQDRTRLITGLVWWTFCSVAKGEFQGPEKQKPGPGLREPVRSIKLPQRPTYRELSPTARTTKLHSTAAIAWGGNDGACFVLLLGSCVNASFVTTRGD